MIRRTELTSKLKKVDLSKTFNFLTGFFDESEIRKAAVIIPLVCREDGWRLLFIRRTKNQNDQHSGQVAFPGGKYELPDKTLNHTALREFAEETGIERSKLEIVGQLAEMITITKFRITPFVAILENDFRAKPDLSEVDKIFEIPLDWLSDQANLNIYDREIEGKLVNVAVFNPYDGETLWGASARLTMNLISILNLG